MQQKCFDSYFPVADKVFFGRTMIQELRLNQQGCKKSRIVGHEWNLPCFTVDPTPVNDVHKGFACIQDDEAKI